MEWKYRAWNCGQTEPTQPATTVKPHTNTHHAHLALPVASTSCTTKKYTHSACQGPTPVQGKRLAIVQTDSQAEREGSEQRQRPREQDAHRLAIICQHPCDHVRHHDGAKVRRGTQVACTQQGQAVESQGLSTWTRHGTGWVEGGLHKRDTTLVTSTSDTLSATSTSGANPESGCTSACPHADTLC